MDSCYAVTAPGLEALVAEELRQLGLLPAQGSQPAGAWGLAGEEGGGVAFQGSPHDIYRANLLLRTASRILIRLGDFHAVNFSDLHRKAKGLAWERFLSPGQPVTLHVTCHKSRLYHSGAVAERVVEAIGDRLNRPTPMQKPSETSPTNPPQLVIVRFQNDHCTISIDSSGELLHRRGYRLETGKAPLRETLAAALVLASGWNQTVPLLDPFCGSGTIAIEAALLAQGVPPGAKRRFVFMRWPDFDWSRWEQLRTAEIAKARPASVRIQASDRDAGAIRIAEANAERAGVSDLIEFTCQAVSAVQPPPEPGYVVTNPPYGIRVSANKDLRNLYAQFGNVLRMKYSGWKVTVLGSDLKLLGQLGIQLDTGLSTINGGVSVRVARGIVT